MLAEGTIVSGYRVDGMLGEGGMGAVYQATQLSLNRVVALKLLAANLGDDPGFRARFEREGQVQAGLDHDHIVPVYEAGQSEYGLFLAMRLIPGPTLKQLIIDDSLDPRRSVRILTQVAHALDAAHRAGLIHRDIKPQNILIGERDHAFLADFGLIKAPDEARLTGTGQFIGTIDYVAPEQIQGEPATPASDIYALTGVLYECLTGEVPFPKPSEAATLHAHVMHPPPTVSERRPDLPPALDGVVAQGMAKDPWSRPSLAGELIQAASRALSSSAPSIATASGLPQREAATAERERRVQTTKVPAVVSEPDPATGAATSDDPAPAPGREVTRAVLRPDIGPIEPAEPADSLESRETDRGLPPRLVALLAALTLVVFAAGFVAGLIVH
ncbi:MAG: serine/threonine protein kinase [Solirubrobacterales bacterium]|nr:serine/threonine protein kinase [Solirubrobacterales bacterium]